MSVETGLTRFDTRRTVRDDESSEQTDLRAVGIRERGQLALDEITQGSPNQPIRADAGEYKETTRKDEDVEAVLECARTTIDGLCKQVKALRTERDHLRRKVEADADE